MSPLRKTFIYLLAKFTRENALIEKLWIEIEENYSGKDRHYHTLQHLDKMLEYLTEARDKIQDWDAILFSVYYHDIIYEPSRADNEERSAQLAAQRLNQVGVPSGMIKKCTDQIMTTKSHQSTEDGDTNYLIDADLSILGQSWEKYSEYCENIRKEYVIYPSALYNAGRKKTLNHFLAMERIFKTDFFFSKFDQKARENIKKEIDTLTHK